MTYLNVKTGELKDGKIVSDIQKAALRYESGCIAEAYDILKRICDAIEEFERINDEIMTSGGRMYGHN